MKGHYLISQGSSPIRGNIYADRSALILNWLLNYGIERSKFSLRELSADCQVSLGLVQRVVSALVHTGIVQAEGVRTAKHYRLVRPTALMTSWLEYYHIVDRCKKWTYRTGLTGRRDLLAAIRRAGLGLKVAATLHLAAAEHGCKNTNLETVELYLLEPEVKGILEEVLDLEPQERGYEVLFIEPYYKSILKSNMEVRDGIGLSSPLLTYMDLYNFPLRGREQAEIMAERIPSIKQILESR